MDFKIHLENLKKLDLPEGQFVVVGSGPMGTRGIRESQDLDVIVTATLWDDLIKKYPTVNKGGIDYIVLENDIEIIDPVTGIFSNSSVVPVEEIFEKADLFDGIKFINLDNLKKIKAKMARDKDLRDIELIDIYLSSN